MLSKEQVTALVAPQHLSARETEVCTQLLRGRDELEIAESLGISPHTVRAHVRRIYLKLDVHSRFELLAHLLSERGHPTI